MLQDLAPILIIVGLIAALVWREQRHRRIQDVYEARFESMLKSAGESELRYRSIFENSLDGIFLTAPDGRILAANPAACRMLQRSEEEICRIGREGVVDASDPQVYAALDERSETGKFSREMRLLRKDGTSFPAEVSSAVFADNSGELRTSMIVRDVSARKQAEAARQENEARFRMLIEKMPALLWATDENLRYTYMAGAALAQVGLRPEQVIGKQVGELSDQQNQAIVRAVELNRGVLAGQPVSYDIEVMGRILHCDIEPLRDLDGQVVGTLGVSLDVTEHRMADREIVKLSRAIEQTDDTVIVADKAGVIEYVNPAFETVTGFTSAEAVGSTTSLLKSGLHNEDFYHRLWETILSGQPFRAEFINRKKTGDLFHEEKTISPIRNENGEITHFISTGKDITERVMAYQNLQKMVQERTLEVERLFARADQRSRELEALYITDEQLYRHLRLDEILRALVDVVIENLHADKSSVQVWSEEQQGLTVAASRGLSAETIELICGHSQGDGISAKVFASGEPLAVEDMFNAAPPTNLIARQEGVHSLLCVPIRMGEKIFGVFSLLYAQPRKFSADEQRLLMAISQRAGMAITNAHLYEQAEQAAVQEERQRMARDLHDSVTQSLYSLTLIAEAGRRMAVAGDLDQAGHYISRLGETAHQALKEMRLMVFEMRPADLQEVGLVKALQQRLDDVEKRTGMNVHLQVTGQADLPEAMVMPVYHIAQEALNNALKHADARKIDVSISAVGEDFELDIQDDGCGYDPDMVNEMGGMGLRNMRERARQIGADLRIQTQPGSGTRVMLFIHKGAA